MRRAIAINEEKESDSEINLTPMLDVVFIMLNDDSSLELPVCGTGRVLRFHLDNVD